MSTHLNYEFLFVGRDENSFLENYVYDSTEDLGEKGGRLWVTIEIQNNPAEAEAIAEAIFERMRKRFFTDLEKEPYARFEAGLKDVNKTLESFKEEKSSHYIGNLSVVIAASVKNELLISQCGEAEAYLIRKRYVSVLTEGLSEDNYEFFMNIASGTLEMHDFVVLCSSRLLRYISKTEFSKSVVAGDVIKSLEELKEAVSPEILGKIAIAGIGVSEKQMEEPVSSDRLEEEIEEGAVTRPSFLASKFGFLKSLSPYLKSEKFRNMRNIKDKLKFDKIDFDNLKVKAGDAFKKAMELKGRFVKPESYKDKALAIAIAGIVLLGVVIGVVKYSQGRSADLLVLDQKLNAARDEISEAMTKGQYDKLEAARILSHAEQSAREVLNTDMRAKATEVLAKIQDTRDVLDNVKRSTPTLFMDLNKVKSGINALGVLFLKDRMYIFDESSLFEILLDKIGEPMKIAEGETVIAGTVFADRASLVFLTKSGKLIEFKDGIFRYPSTADGVFHKGVSIKAWGDRVYILSPEEDQIWRYSYLNTKDAFGNAEAYKKDGDLKNAVDFALDGNVFVALNDGQIIRYYRGNAQTTPMTKTPFRPMVSASKIFTDDEMMQIFALDSSENRLYIFQKEKKGEELSYSKQYQFDGVGEIRSLYFDKTANLIYFLDSKNIYKLTLL
ncbi:MAG: hypothetical protein US92_C0011G0009 [Candidatus Peregrinibacteria bacterium GW2011_GWA2_38_36]|nr:MAG: hypothetical protein US92_C0011G0009 [Candidatus Peregrinibacteria bacterium GW2011_GWA2_38_36]